MEISTFSTVAIPVPSSLAASIARLVPVPVVWLRSVGDYWRMSGTATDSSNAGGGGVPAAAVAAASGILRSLSATVGDALVSEIVLRSNILLVGAGGIGCELLKNLALTGFSNITVVDLDTIDVSNLNRQLLFRSHHVGQPKCVVACQVAAQLAVSSSSDRSVTYTPLHGNVCDSSQFHVEFFKPFALILNALDNVVARRRVNRLALAANVPLIEAGTTGYLGQVTTIHKGSETACYECHTQETGKVYPICTIRSTPSAPVHCIVWAKELYKLIFGDSVEESMLYEDGTVAVDDDGKTTEGGSTGEPSTYMESVLELRPLLQRQTPNGNSNGTTSLAPNDAVEDVTKRLVRNLYVDEIQKQLDMDRYKTAQKKPVVLNESAIVTTTIVAPTMKSSYQPTDLWTSDECVAEVLACVREAVADPDIVLPVFDKDDDLAMRFVTATSNLRATIFGIEPSQSFYSAKGIAGNIIPAIATTNAIVAGLQILQCFSVLRAQLDVNTKNDTALTTLRQDCSYVNCLRNSTRNGLFLTAASLEPPNPKCFVCSKASIPIQLTVNKWTLSDFVAKICKANLGFENPSISMADSGDCIWEEGDEADADTFAGNAVKLLPTLPCGGIHNGTVLSVEDFSQDLEVQITIAHVEDWRTIMSKGGDDDVGGADEVAEDHKFVVGGGTTKPNPVVQTANTNKDDSKNDDEGGDDVVDVVSNLDNASENADGHRKRAAATTTTAFSPTAKKAKGDATNNDVIEIEE